MYNNNYFFQFTVVTELVVQNFLIDLSITFLEQICRITSFERSRVFPIGIDDKTIINQIHILDKHSKWQVNTK